MYILEFQNRIDVTTPKGKGSLWLVTDYGHETDKIFTILHDNGEIWEFRTKDIKLRENVTFGRKS